MTLEKPNNPSSPRNTVYEVPQSESPESSITKVAITALLICVLTLTAATASIAIFNPTVAIAATVVAVACLICTIAGMILGISLNQILNPDNQFSNIDLREQVDLKEQEIFQNEIDFHAPPLKLSSNVKSEDVKAYSQGLTNPSSSCFMNAMLQNAFSLDQLGTYITRSLETIAQDSSQNKNPFLDDFSILLSQAKGETNDALEGRKQSLKEQYNTQRPQFITIKDTALDSVLNTYFKNKHCFDDFYKALTLKEAATYALAIIKKWQSKEHISSDEAKLLRVALIKLMNERLVLNCKKDEKNPMWQFPGIDRSLKIDYKKQECPAEFFRLFISSLEELTKISPPSSLTITRVSQAFKIDKSTTSFADSLKIHETNSAENPSLIIHSIDQTQEVLNLESLAEIEKIYQTSKKSEDKEFFTQAEQALQDQYPVVDSSISYTMKFPEELVMQIKLNNPDQKQKIKLQFSDENNLSITLASSALNLQPKTYQLKSFVVHIGSAKGGHYINYIQKTHSNGSSFWIEQNDAYSKSVNAALIKALLNGDLGPYMTPYILAFQAI